MNKKYISLKIKPTELLGFLFQALAKNEELNITLSENESDNHNAPEYVGKGCAAWIKDSKF